VIARQIAIQDKAISFVETIAVLYVKTSAGWKERGFGSAISTRP